jgi:tetratricopeptide (TPR) repeat protein
MTQTLALLATARGAPALLNQPAPRSLLAAIDRLRPAVNAASMIGLGTIRRVVFGNADRPATSAEIQRMTARARRALEQGAYGASSGLERRAMRASHSIAAGILFALSAATGAGAQSVQYRSPEGVSYRSQPDTGAIARAEQALAANPGNVEAILALGAAQAGARQFREAIATYTRGIEIAPRNALLYRWRGHRYLSVREHDRALADFERGMALDSSVYGIWYHLGVLRFIKGEFTAAAAAFARGRSIAPNPGELAGSYDWGWMSLMRAGKGDEARGLLASMPDSVPRAAANAYAQRLRLYKGEIGPDAVFTPADTADVAVATLAFGLGNWYLVRADSAKARELFTRSVASGGWPGFAFMASEAELRRMR